MPLVNSDLFHGTQGKKTRGKFVPPIEQSLIFNGAAYLSWTPGSAGNQTTWTWAGWIRLSKYSAAQTIFGAGSVAGGGNFTGALFEAGNNLTLYWNNSSGATVSSAVFRDVGWYHVTLVADTTTLTAYVNGIQIAQKAISGSAQVNSSSVVHRIGEYPSGGTGGQLNGAMADIHFLDGTALTESQIQETFLQDWNFDRQVIPVPKKVVGLSYGTNGFHLDFSNSAAFGTDRSGNGNNWTPTGFVASDKSKDVPSRPYGLWNPLFGFTSASFSGPGVIANGGRTWNVAASFNSNGRSILEFDASENWYWETNIDATSFPQFFNIGIAPTHTNSSYSDQSQIYTYLGNGTKTVAGVNSAYGASWTANDRLGFHLSGGTLTCYKQTGGAGAFASQGALATGLSGKFTIFVTTPNGTSNNLTLWVEEDYWNNSSPPANALPLSTNNLPTPLYAGKNWFNSLIYAGDASSPRTIIGAGFPPDFVWGKVRTSSGPGHLLLDRVRGVGTGKALQSNSTAAEGSNALADATYGYLSALAADGFTVTAGSSTMDNWNKSGDNYVAWVAKAGGAGVANTDGTISSTVSVAAPGHFGIVGYTGNGTAGATIGHGLGGVPELIIIKNRDVARNWLVFLPSILGVGNSDYLMLDQTGAEGFAGALNSLNSTAPTSSLITLGNDTNVNENTRKFIAYLFRSIPGLCKVGSYIGNGSADGPLIDLGFTARWILFKNISTTVDWVIIDTARDPINVAGNELFPNLTNAENVGNADLDVNSSGFKIRRNSTFANGSGNTIIYLALAELAGGGDLPWPLAR